MSSDAAGSEDEDPDARDAALLRQLTLARKRPDGALRAELIIAELLARHQPNIRRIVAWRAYSRRPSNADIDEIVNTVLIAVADVLQGDFDPEMPFGALVAKNIPWDVIDWVRKRDRRAGEVHVEVGDLADVAEPHAPTLADEARELRKLIAGLAGRDREIVTQRMLFGLKPEMIADIHGISRAAVDTATSRALKKLLASDELAAERERRDVRNPSLHSEEEI